MRHHSSNSSGFPGTFCDSVLGIRFTDRVGRGGCLIQLDRRVKRSAHFVPSLPSRPTVFYFFSFLTAYATGYEQRAGERDSALNGVFLVLRRDEGVFLRARTRESTSDYHIHPAFGDLVADAWVGFSCAAGLRVSIHGSFFPHALGYTNGDDDLDDCGERECVIC
jgi:hypothetical protein